MHTLISQVTGETALFFVAANGKEDLVRKMLDLGADPNVENHVSLVKYSIIVISYSVFHFHHEGW